MTRRTITPAQSDSIARDFEAMNTRDDLPLMVAAVFIAALILGLIGGALALSAIEKAAHDAHQIRTLGYVAMMEGQP